MQGFSREILAWDPVAESWQVPDFDQHHHHHHHHCHHHYQHHQHHHHQVASQLDVGRVYAGVTEVPLSAVNQNCTAIHI